MWLMTKLGFFSVVCARADGGKGPMDPNLLQIRARMVAHLRALQNAFPEQLGSLEIRVTPNADYGARLIVPKYVWVAMQPAMVDMIDYGNFKNELTRTGQHRYHDACSRVWAVMHGLQTDERAEDRRGGQHVNHSSWRVTPRELNPMRDAVERAMNTGAPKVSETRDSNPMRALADKAMGRGIPKVSTPRPDVPAAADTFFAGPTRPDHTAEDRAQVVVVGAWSAGRNSPIEWKYVLTDIDHYKRSRVAARDAVTHHGAEKIPRSRLLFVRMPAWRARLGHTNLKRFSMKGIVPSVGVDVVKARANGAAS
jgi:hypothetical protein